MDRALEGALRAAKELAPPYRLYADLKEGPNVEKAALILQDTSGLLKLLESVEQHNQMHPLCPPILRCVTCKQLQSAMENVRKK